MVPSQAHQADKGLIYIRVTMRVRIGTVANRAVSVADTQRTTMASCSLRADGFNQETICRRVRHMYLE
jgi:hypothetical protein